MNITYRYGIRRDWRKLKELAVNSWEQYRPALTPENWQILFDNLTDDATYTWLLDKSRSFICTTGKDEIIGMAFLVSHGNPTDIYDKEWCYIRFVTVDPNFSGQGIGRKLTTLCVDSARQNGEKVIALHTSELMNAARHIYESLGFKIVKEIDQQLGKRYWLYMLNLNEAVE
ncbi:GNAT family N-acetyltransferase [Compostibacter hankyongensis]|uniref:N-acetyltransferase domain-containing protein n=1 Tax=Compostibacter hankyongensis TaxID=1007089 RepID=A0ABP8FI50_9BACT